MLETPYTTDQLTDQVTETFSSRVPQPVASWAKHVPLSERLKCLTLTGIDEGFQLETLYELSRHFPFVEFGVLLSDSLSGQGRYPSSAWIAELVEALCVNPGPRVALHVCGSAVGSLLDGTSNMRPYLEHFSRVQLNFTANRYPLASLRRLLKDTPNVTFITQFSPGYGEVWKDLADLPNHAVLFGASAGCGITPVSWPAPLCKTEAGLPFKHHSPMCGYAGNLGPDNLERRFRQIARLSKSAPFWLGAEAKLRVNDKFDLGLAMKCLEVMRAVLQEQPGARRAA